MIIEALILAVGIYSGLKALGENLVFEFEWPRQIEFEPSNPSHPGQWRTKIK